MNLPLSIRPLVFAVFVCCALGIECYAATTNTFSAPPIPALPEARSPVDSFRALLVMPTSDRNALLATRTAEARERILAKISEYQALTPDERELRLKATELRWYLKPLMSAPATNRTAQLRFIPENFREMIAARLEQWDKISPAIQRLILTNEHGANLVTVGRNTPTAPPLPTEKIRSALQKRLEKLFELTDTEKEKVLATLSEVERKQMERTLESFDALPPVQRRQCIVSFSKFAEMNATERAEFLKNAQRWSEMPAAERQSWRELVSTAQKMPPLPPIVVRPPPLPSNPNRPHLAPTTNGG